MMKFDRKNLSNDQLIAIYENLLWPRLIEEKMLVLLRQGRISKWFSGILISVSFLIHYAYVWDLPLLELSKYLHLPRQLL